MHLGVVDLHHLDQKAAGKADLAPRPQLQAVQEELGHAVEHPRRPGG